MIPHEKPIFIPINEMLMYPQIDLSEWSQVGEGYNGQEYGYISEMVKGKKSFPACVPMFRNG